MPPCHRLSRLVIAASVLMLSAGCALRTQSFAEPIHPDLYVSGTVYLYQPLNPTTIWVRDPEPCELASGDTLADITSPEFKRALLRDLDTETVRISVSRVGGNGTATAAVVGTSVKGESYVLIIDYIKYFTGNTPVDIQYNPGGNAGGEATERFTGKVPIYAGIGVRIRAEFVAFETGLNISGLPGLAVAASANKINGRLTVQTLGITGPDITGLMPIISDVSIASIQSAVQAVAAIKAKLYEDSTVAYPKIVGFESPSASVDAIRKITALLYGLDEQVAPRVSPNPMKAGETILWIKWFSSSPAGGTCPGRDRAAN